MTSSETPRPKLAVTMTMAGCETWLADWIEHHRKIFDRLLIWIDDPDELVFARTFAEPQVLIALGDQGRARSRLTQTLTRQEMNTNFAVVLCARDGIDWLLHIDADELFIAPDPDLWTRDIGQLRFVNHECVPVWTAARPLVEIDRFKANGHPGFMLYSNGKAAVRCCRNGAALAPLPTASGVHEFSVGDTASIWATTGSVLHFACPTFDLWLEKYQRMGRFSDYWYDDESAPIAIPFHTRSRDLAQEALDTGDLTACRGYFATFVEPANSDGVFSIKRSPAGIMLPPNISAPADGRKAF